MKLSTSTGSRKPAGKVVLAVPYLDIEYARTKQGLSPGYPQRPALLGGFSLYRQCAGRGRGSPSESQGMGRPLAKGRERSGVRLPMKGGAGGGTRKMGTG